MVVDFVSVLLLAMRLSLTILAKKLQGLTDEYVARLSCGTKIWHACLFTPMKAVTSILMF